MKVRAILAGTIVAMAFSGRAHAQATFWDLNEEQRSELQCLMMMVDDTNVRDDFAAGALGIDDDDLVESAFAKFDAAADACQKSYGWSNPETNLAYDFTELVLMVAYLEDEVEARPGSAGLVKKAKDVVAGLSESDRQLILSGRWVTDYEFKERLRNSFMQAGANSLMSISLGDIVVYTVERDAAVAEWIANGWHN